MAKAMNINEFQANFLHFIILGCGVSNFLGENDFNPFWNKAATWQNVEQVKSCEYFPDALYPWKSKNYYIPHCTSFKSIKSILGYFLSISSE